MLYTLGVHDLATIKTVVSALKKPLNLVTGFADPTLTVEQLSAAYPSLNPYSGTLPLAP